MSVVNPAHQSEPWPVWAKMLIILVSLLVITMALPWLFMSYAMATSCTPMMGQMFEMMRDGMMR